MQRTGAGSYLISMSLAVLLWSVGTIYICKKILLPGTIALDKANYLITFMGSGVGILFYWISARRMKDLNFPKWSIKVLSFPLLALILLPVLCFLSGPRYENDYGEAPRPSGLMKILLALVLCGAATIYCYSALITYASSKYILLQHSTQKPADSR